ncbi:hypothetical protein Tco_0320478 [Tanacetum coccineum]
MNKKRRTCFLKPPSNDSDDEDEANIMIKAEGDKDEDMDYTTSQLYDECGLYIQLITISNIPHTDAEIVSPMDVHIHHEVPSQQTPILLIVHVSFITDSSPVYSTIIPQSLPSFTSPPQQSISTPPPKTEAINHQSALPDFAPVFQFNNRVTALSQYLGSPKRERGSLSYLSAFITTRITEQVKIQLPQILPKEVSNFAPPEIQRMVTESLEEAVLAKESSQPQSSYKAVATLIKFKLKKILIDKIGKSKSYMAALEHREYYEGLIKSYDLDNTLFSTYDKVYSLKRSRKDKDKDEVPSTGSD